MPKPKKYVGQRNALVSERMLNVILKFVSRVVQSTYRLRFFCFSSPNKPNLRGKNQAPLVKIAKEFTDNAR